MNAVSPVAQPAAHAMPFSTKRYAAFRVAEIAKGRDRTYRVDLKDPAGSVAEAVNAAVTAQLFEAKDKLVIRETDDGRGTVLLHLFAIKKQSRPTYVFRDHAQHREHRHYADPLCILDGNLLADRVGQDADTLQRRLEI